ncbi:carboxypeptidase-like regulatory domain-containing protein [Acidicapsa ligni]|uniref:carboxypeptidase-like regulatory domain-containing protein n=1 Tax=Acidicapsa ligni TaxID=542300 RepID=UPI0021DF7A41|nr:carboxypeptidase-like regulatory domain-containing protein [Acidicapsa ligni]
MLLVLGLLLVWSSANAQEFRATLTGRVSDSADRVLVKATVTAVNNETQQMYTATTSKEGVYYVPYVLPGTYTVSATVNGFKTGVQDSVLVQATEYRSVNFKLQVGSISENVVVTDALPLLDMASGSGGTVISQRELESAPLNGRQVYMLLGTTPGSQFTTTSFGASGNSGTRGWDVTNAYIVGGGAQGYQQFTLNGTNITEQSTGGKGSWELAPNVDALQEVNVMTSTYDARYGRTGGGTVNMVVKSGTNALHGTLYNYLENGDFNANNFENNRAGMPREGMHQNQFGATVGGPIIHNKVFFFGSYEGFRESIAFTTLTSVPTAELHPSNGGDVNFTSTGYTVYDPATTRCSVAGGMIGNCSGTYIRDPFPNDTIPGNRINSIGAAVLNLYPLPNINTTSIQNNFIANTPDQYAYDQEMGRVDYNTSDRTRWYSLFAYQSGSEYRNSSGFPSPAMNGNINVRHQTMTASQDMTHTFSPTLMLDLKASFARYALFSPDGDLSHPVDPATIGLNMPSLPTTNLKQLPEFTTSQFYPQVVGNVLTSGVYNDISFNGDLTKELNTQAFHFGGEYHMLQHGTPGQAGHANGDFSFGTFATQQNPLTRNGLDGFPIADMLLGTPQSGGVDWNANDFVYFPTWAIYVQDDWKATKKLSLNLGLRYDVNVGARSRQNGLNRGMCLTCVNPTTTNPTYQANLAAASGALSAAGINPSSLSTVYGGIQFAGANGQPSDAYNTDFGNIAPRIGFAYQINSKTVVRGGYGLMYSIGLENGTFSGSSETTSYNASLNGNIMPTNYFATGTPFPNGAQQPLGAAGGLLTAIGNSQSLDFPQRKIPYADITSFGVQRELPDSMTLDVRYSGNFAYHQRVGTTLNSLSATALQAGIANPNIFDRQVPNPYYGVLPITSSIGSSPTIKALTLMLPYSAFGQVSWDAAPLGRNLYNALEVKLNKRLGGPDALSFQLAYTYSKTMTAGGFQNSYPYQDANLKYEISSFDRTHIFTLSDQWSLPVGRGQRFLSNPGRVVGAVINRWQFSSILSMQTGFPVSLNTNYYYNCDHSFTPQGGASLSHYIYNDYSNGTKLGCFTAIPEYALKNLPDRLSSLRQPTTPNLDATLQKSIAFTDKYHLTIRADAFNLTNSVLFPGPDSNPADGPPVEQANGGYTGFGTVTLNQQNFPRILQFALKLAF